MFGHFGHLASASPFVTFGISALTALALILALHGFAWADGVAVLPLPARRRRLLITGFLAFDWVLVTGLLAASGVLLRFDLRPPPAVLLMASVLVGGIALGLSPLGKHLAQHLPLWALIAFQGFRLPLELVMHQAAVEGTMPKVMSFTGYNFDIFTGALALPIAWLVAKKQAPRWLVYAWSAWGLGCLVVIAVVAIGASPLVRAFGSAPEELNTWVFYVPFVWLPAVLVLLALAGQVIVVRALGLQKTLQQRVE